MKPNSSTNIEKAEILLKGWETFQSLAKSNSESAWNLRAWGISVWSALIAYSYTSNKGEIIVIAIITLVAVFLIELAIRQIQYKYIEKSISIECSINDLLVGDAPRLPPGGISTNIDTPTILDLLSLFHSKRWLIWLPYLILFVFSIYSFKYFQT